MDHPLALGIARTQIDEGDMFQLYSRPVMCFVQKKKQTQKTCFFFFFLMRIHFGRGDLDFTESYSSHLSE